MNGELPNGWVTTQIDDIAEINPRHGSNIGDGKLVTFVPMPLLSETIPEFDATTERPFGEVRKGYTHFAEGDVLFAKITPCMENGKAGVATGLRNGLGCGTTEIHVLRPRTGIDSKYLYHFVHQKDFRREAAGNFTGTAGQLRVPVSFIRGAEIPLAPFREQQRIVAALEALLPKVETSRQRAHKIQTILKRFRQSVLAAACSGRLTADWREENGVSEAFEQSTVEAIADYVGGFAYKSPTFLKTGKNQVIRIGNVGQLSLRLEASPVFIPDHIAEQTERFRLLTGDVVISMTGTKYKHDYGFASLVQQPDRTLFLNQRVGRLRCREKVLPAFLLYWLQTNLFREFFFAGETGNVNQGNVGADGIRRAPIELPSLPEQQEIIGRVAALFNLADRIEDRYREAKKRVDNLASAILAKAFRGELVPQDLKDEPASVLLARLAERKANTL
jgi:type I restriction enzyme S subunit